MVRSLRAAAAVALLGLVLGVFVGAGNASRQRAAGSATCYGGPISSGYYASITVYGNCTMPTGQVKVAGNVTVEPGAALNAVTRATLTVFGNLYVLEGGSLGLGCSPAAGCPVTTHDRIAKALKATNPASVIVHSATIGSVLVVGGEGRRDCDLNPVTQGPDYLTFEDTSISGDAVISGYVACWLGFIRNSVGGNVTLADNALDDPDAMEVVTNFILGNLACYGNDPAPQLGDSGGLPNVVKGAKLGQCASL